MVLIVVLVSAPIALGSTWMVQRGVAFGDPGPGNRPVATPSPQPGVPGRWSAGGDPDDPQKGWPEPEPRAGLSEAQGAAAAAVSARPGTRCAVAR
jgi:hypothetical protein